MFKLYDEVRNVGGVKLYAYSSRRKMYLHSLFNVYALLGFAAGFSLLMLVAFVADPEFFEWVKGGVMAAWQALR